MILMSTYVAELNNVVENLDENQILKVLDYAKNMIARVKRTSKVDNLKNCRYGIADGLYEIPDDIDGCNEAIAEMFGV